MSSDRYKTKDTLTQSKKWLHRFLSPLDPLDLNLCVLRSQSDSFMDEELKSAKIQLKLKVTFLCEKQPK